MVAVRSYITIAPDTTVGIQTCYWFQNIQMLIRLESSLTTHAISLALLYTWTNVILLFSVGRCVIPCAFLVRVSNIHFLVEKYIRIC